MGEGQKLLALILNIQIIILPWSTSAAKLHLLLLLVLIQEMEKESSSGFRRYLLLAADDRLRIIQKDVVQEEHKNGVSLFTKGSLKAHHDV